MGDEVLVAEDEESIYRLISFKLKSAGLEVDTATDGNRAWDLLQSNSYSVLVLDLMLPKLNGMQIMKRIKESELEISVLILSAKSQEDDVLAGLEAGADDYLTKPFRPNELIARVKKLL